MFVENLPFWGLLYYGFSFGHLFDWQVPRQQKKQQSGFLSGNWVDLPQESVWHDVLAKEHDALISSLNLQ